MKAAAWNAERSLSLVERPDPVDGARQVVVRVSACGICGSDLHFFRGEFQPQPGLIPGHEFAGTVVSGDAFSAGTAVAVEPLLGCRVCPQCMAGLPMLCPSHRLIGMGVPGGMQQAISVPAECVYPLPASVDPIWGSLAEPLAVCVRAVNLGQIPFGARVLVLGSGAIGLLSLLLARSVASEVAITARYPHQRAMAERFGASAVLEPGSAEFRAWTKAHPGDVVIETVGGSADTLADALSAVRGGGTIVVVGVFTSRSSVPAFQLVAREARLVGSLMYGYPGGRSEFGAAVKLLARYPAELQLLQTATFPLARATDAFEMAANKSSGSLKVTVLPND